ncbi:MAG: HAD family hydrolase [Victivallaceae bacterium]|nr:HAD family hydrolase [Victivallaceae bacterium]
MKRALFLDRDGVIIRQKPYLHSPDQVELENGVAAGLREFRAAGFLIVAVTNQSGVARGLFTLADVEKVHRRIEELLAAEDASIDAFYICPHHPDFGSPCDCRKPAPGLLLQAARELDIDLEASVMCGDKLGDLEAGKNAGCPACILLRTGYGRDEEANVRVAGFSAVCDDFPALTHFLLGGHPSRGR